MSRKVDNRKKTSEETKAPEMPIQEALIPTIQQTLPPSPAQERLPSPIPQRLEEIMNGFFSHMQQEQQAFMRQVLQEQRDFMEEMSRKRQEELLTSERSTPRIGREMTLEQTPAELEIEIPEANIRRINRRDSAVTRLTTFQANPREGMLTMESDKHTQIKWETRTVDSFLKFFEDIDKFVLTYNQPVPHLFTHISDNLQEVISELLYVNKPQKYGNRNDVFKATTQDIYEMVQLYFAPRDLAHFIMLLMTSCKRYEVIQKGD